MQAKQVSVWMCDKCKKLFDGEDGRTRAAFCCVERTCACGASTGSPWLTACRACKFDKTVKSILAGDLGELVSLEDLPDDAAFFEIDDHQLYCSLEEWIEHEVERIADELGDPLLRPAGPRPSAQAVLCIAEPVPWRPSVESWLENEEEEYLMGTDGDRFLHDYAEEIAEAQKAIDRISAPVMLTDSRRFVDVRPLHKEIWDYVKEWNE